VPFQSSKLLYTVKLGGKDHRPKAVKFTVFKRVFWKKERKKERKKGGRFNFVSM